MSSTAREAPGFAARDAALLFAVCVALTVAAAAAFPAMDDGYLALLLREHGPAGAQYGHPDRPLVALLLKELATVTGPRFWTAAFVIHAVLWTLIGLEASALWRRLFPEWAGASVGAGLLAVTPIVAQVQLTTATITLFGVLSVVLAYGALLLILDAVETSRTGRFVLGALLAAGSVLLTEYGLAAVLAAAALLVFGAPSASADRRRLRLAAVVLLAVAAIAYSVFLLTSNLRDRPDVDPRKNLRSVDLLTNFPFSAASRLWRDLAGAYGAAAGNFSMARDSKSTILAVGAGLLLALVVFAVGRWRTLAHAEPSGRLGGLCVAVVAGILPVALMRPYFNTPFASRFDLPVLPLAAAWTLAALLTVLQPRFRLGAVIALAFLAGVTGFTASWGAVRHRRLMREAGKAIRNQVAPDGLTLVAMSSWGQPCDVSEWCTAQMTADWPLELSERVWVLDPGDAAKFLSPRADPEGRVDFEMDIRGVRRTGPVRRILWLEGVGEKFRVEPYFPRSETPAP